MKKKQMEQHKLETAQVSVFHVTLKRSKRYDNNIYPAPGKKKNRNKTRAWKGLAALQTL